MVDVQDDQAERAPVPPRSRQLEDGSLLERSAVEEARQPIVARPF